jgi:protein involved in polysaccharide export with SLBB domain
VWIETVLGERNQLPPVIPGTGSGLGTGIGLSRLPPALGFPIPVRDDGTLPLPLIKPARVQGLTLEEVEEALQRAYGETKILEPGRDNIW